MAQYNIVVDITYRIAVGGVVGETRLSYGQVTNVPSLTSSEVNAYVVANQVPAFLDVMSDAAQILSVTSVVYKIPASGSSPAMTQAINLAGVNASQAMQPYSTGVIIKIPDNTTISDDTKPDFLAGRIGIMGMAENWQDAGLLTSDGIDALQDLIGVILDIEPVTSGSPVTLPMVMYRRNTPAGTGTTKVTVPDLAVRGNLGTQNSRKY